MVIPYNKKLLIVTLLLLIGATIVWRILEHNNDKKNIQLVLQPQVGDIYEMATENGHYTLLKVGKVAGESVLVHINEYEANKKSQISQLRDEPFRPEEILFTKQTLRVMLKEGKILNVER
ncbi:hypothetical protein [Niastella sp. OAS944]|uniref:hypothetical protein n=1 Tax=Niastella sp. OAS944 TaxID=2664089 RepID=UPI0035C848A8|nr:hypothetical protein [Chitinophagaceae bacterium OAS944]